MSRADAIWSDPTKAEAGLDSDDQEVDQLRELVVDLAEPVLRPVLDDAN